MRLRRCCACHYGSEQSWPAAAKTTARWERSTQRKCASFDTWRKIAFYIVDFPLYQAGLRRNRPGQSEKVPDIADWKTPAGRTASGAGGLYCYATCRAADCGTSLLAVVAADCLRLLRRLRRRDLWRLLLQGPRRQ